MPASSTTNGDGTVVLASSRLGQVVVPQPNRLKRLNYFDGKFLRATDLQLEQDHLRRLVHVSNQAGGPGVVAGLDTTLAGDALRIGPGQAIDSEGRVLLLTQPAELDLQDLIEASRRAPGSSSAAGDGAAAFGDCEVAEATAPVTLAGGGDLYVIWLGHAEALCGEEDVFGRLCEAACETSTDRPYRLEGVVVRALPLELTVPPVPGGSVAIHARHLRSRVASAFYAAEWAHGGSLVSAAGLATRVWCLGSHPDLGGDVPIAIVARSASPPWIDQWIVRRERYEPPARGYWARKLAMRGWAAYLAQILQFQCQLADLPAGGGPAAPGTCEEALDEARRFLAAIESDIRGERRSAERVRILERLERRLAEEGTSSGAALIDGGVIETPPAGYLPVRLDGDRTVDKQIAAWFGTGVELRFCIVRPDFVAHALEAAQHMERISLLAGLADPKNKPRVDVLVPNGRPAERARVATGRGWDTRVGVSSAAKELPYGATELRGVTRTEAPAGGGGALHFAGGVEVQLPRRSTQAAARSQGNLVQAAPDLLRRAQAQLWLTAACLKNVFELETGTVTVRAEAAAAVSVGPVSAAASASAVGALKILSTALTHTGARRVRAQLTGVAEVVIPGGPDLDPVKIPRVDLILTLLESDTGGRLDVQLVAPEDLDSRLEEPIAVRVEWDGTPAVATISTVSLRNARGQLGKDAARTAANAMADRFELPHVESEFAEKVDSVLEERITIVVAEEDELVLRESDPRNRRARSNIVRIGALLSDDGFAREALALLFPPLTLAGGATEIVPTLDWVLFHRRREKDCGAVPAPTEPPPPPVQTACHAVFRLPAGRSIEQVQEAIQAGELARARKLLEELGTVEFDAGTARIADAGTLVADWDGGPPPVRAWPYFVESDPDASDDELRGSRVRAIARLVGGGAEIGLFGGPVTGPLDPCGVWTILEPGEAPPTLFRHAVYYLGNDSDAEIIEDLVGTGEVGTVVATHGVPSLGHAAFARDSEALVESESKLDVVPQDHQPVALSALVFYGSDDDEDQPLGPHGQAIAVTAAEGRLDQGFKVEVFKAKSMTDWPAGAAAMTIVVINA